ncbi:MAG: hypothetical protein AAB881_00175 [Patescibacteria group bacterium]
MSPKLFSTIAGLLLFLGAAFGFFWLWNQSRTTSSTFIVSDDLKAVEIETVKTEARDLLSGIENSGNLPVVTPIQKMGRDNPFAGL